VAAVRLLRHKSCTMCQPIKVQIHLWTNRKRLSSVEYASTCCGSGEYTSRCTLHLSYPTDCRMLLTFVLRSKLRAVSCLYCTDFYLNKKIKCYPNPTLYLVIIIQRQVSPSIEQCCAGFVWQKGGKKIPSTISSICYLRKDGTVFPLLLNKR
jgi:hypothetical protein